MSYFTLKIVKIERNNLFLFYFIYFILLLLLFYYFYILYIVEHIIQPKLFRYCKNIKII